MSASPDTTNRPPHGSPAARRGHHRQRRPCFRHHYRPGPRAWSRAGGGHGNCRRPHPYRRRARRQRSRQPLPPRPGRRAGSWPISPARWRPCTRGSSSCHVEDDAGDGGVRRLHGLVGNRDVRPTGQGVGWYAERQLGGVEEERRRIGRELHDETGQTLTATLVRLDLCDQAIQDHDAAGAHAQVVNCKTLIAHTIDEIKLLVYDLRPSMLDDFGLVRRCAGTSSPTSRARARHRSPTSTGRPAPARRRGDGVVSHRPGVAGERRQAFGRDQGARRARDPAGVRRLAHHRQRQGFDPRA